MRKKKKIIIISIIIILLLIPLFISIFLYEQNFNKRFETNEYFKYELNDFENLKRTKDEFASNDGQLLVGYKYYKDDIVGAKGLIVISHGLGGGGHNRYMNYIDYFTSNNYLVFAYDNTGNDESEGNSVNGLSQSVIDLDYALRHIKTSDNYKDLPILLVGHSWGAYAVSSVLNIHTDIKAVLSISGFNKTIDIITEQGKTIVGPFIHVLKPYLSFYEYLKFGKYSRYSSIDGYSNESTKVIIVHSEDDSTISYASSYERYYQEYKDDSRFTFISFKDHGHNYPLGSKASHEYIIKFNEEFQKVYDEYDGSVPVSVLDDIYASLDKNLAFELDQIVMANILEVFDKSILE